MSTGLLASSTEAASSAVASLFGKRRREEPPKEEKPKKKKETAVDASHVALQEVDSAPPPATKTVPAASGAKADTSKTDDDPERLARTVFVGNLPVGTQPKAIKKHFGAHGVVEAVRLRAAAAANPKMSQRAAVITGELTGDAVAAYVVFAERSAALAAIGASGQLAFGRHVRVDTATPKGTGSASTKLHDSRKSVFLGNLPHSVSEETLWQLFGSCGRIAYVRLIREPRTGLGKGFGYVGFHEAGSVERALTLHGTQVAAAAAAGADGAAGDGDATDGGKGRPIRVFRCSAGKSHARLAEQGKAEALKLKRPKAGSGSRGKEASDGGSGGNDQQRKGLGWQQRERRRLQKKLAGRAAAKKGGGGGGGDGSSASKVAKSIMKAASRVAARNKGKGGGAKAGGAGTARARKEAKERQMAKRAKSKAAKRAKSKQPAK